MIALDTNILVYAHREDAPFHAAAQKRLEQVAQGSALWAIPWPCLHEFLAIATHPRIFAPPTPLERALDQIDAWLESPSLVLLAEDEGYWARLRPMLELARVAGPQIHDARIAAICTAHGVRELWSADRDFGRFRALSVVNPLVG
ncbi:MAG TPA: TA system VapC family ribonuclease toxin [Burkholderiales bacterium]